MTNLERVKLELGGKDYFTNDALEVLLTENGLTSSADFEAKDKKKILATVLDVLNALMNNLDVYMKTETEFSNTSIAANHLQDRINTLERKINIIPDDPNEGSHKSVFNFMFHT
jgi:hypothetical protein